MAGFRAAGLLVVWLGAVVACRSSSGVPLASNEVAPILLFAGTGTSANDVAAIEAILNDDHQRYSKANSSELDEMSEARLRVYRLLIVPGGNFLTIGEHLKPDTVARVRDAVGHGLSYLGICAGAIFAGSATAYTSLGLTPGVRFGFYAATRQGLHRTAVKISGAGTPPIDVYWEDGPELSGWGAVVARYPDRTPAVVEGMFDNGWVILSGVHPEAPASWRRNMSFDTPTAVDAAFARSLIESALNRSWLPHD